MTPVNNPNSYMWIALGMVACSGLTAAGQQPLPTPPDADEIPPEHSVIFNSEEDTSSGSGTRESGELINAPVAEAYGDRVIQGPAMPGLDPGCVDCQNPGYDLWDGYPALMESSGTWLRRGFWYSEVDAVMLNRIVEAKSGVACQRRWRSARRPRSRQSSPLLPTCQSGLRRGCPLYVGALPVSR